MKGIELDDSEIFTWENGFQVTKDPFKTGCLEFQILLIYFSQESSISSKQRVCSRSNVKMLIILYHIYNPEKNEKESDK